MISKRILITGGRSAQALELGRKLNAAGHQVYAVDTSNWYLCTYSNAFKKCFTVASPRFDMPLYRQQLLEIVTQYKIEFVIPTFETIFYLSQFLEAFPQTCQVFAERFSKLHKLHHKYEFNQLVESIGLPAPKSALITCAEDLAKLGWDHDYILKKVYSRAAQNFVKKCAGDPLPELTYEANNPWIAQQWVEGRQICTYSICHRGKLVAHTAYPVQFSIDGSSCVFFEAIEHLAIVEWVRKFVVGTQFTGQIAFDFIETPEHKLAVLECNPRTTSGVHLFADNPNFVAALLNQTQDFVQPRPGITRQLAMGMLLYGWRTPAQLRGKHSYLKALLQTPDVVSQQGDRKPFWLQPFAALRYLLLKYKHHLSLPAVFNYDIEWNGEGLVSVLSETNLL